MDTPAMGPGWLTKSPFISGIALPRILFTLEPDLRRAPCPQSARDVNSAKDSKKSPESKEAEVSFLPRPR